jgi:hypothetical protein
VRGSFEFILGMYSIIIGLGVSRLLEGVKDLVVSPRPLRGSLLYIGMLVIGLLVHATTWLSFWTLRDVEAWKVWSFLQLMLAPIALYLYSAITVPDPDRSVDLGEYYLANASKMHGLLIAAIFFNALTEFMVLDQVYSLPLALMRLALLVLLTACAILPRAVRLHRIVVPAVIVATLLLVPLAHSPIE